MMEPTMKQARWRIWRRRFERGGLLVVVISLVAGGWWLRQRYAVATEMTIAIREYSNAEYPEDPADRSTAFGKYRGRTLRLIQRDTTQFDFVFEPTDRNTAKIVFKNIDVCLMTPGEPEWTKSDTGLERIALTDRQWNRQQVSFDPRGEHIEISGGDGFEVANLASAELAKNCLNAGLWEVLLFTNENGSKRLYYQGWFTFPLGHYKELFEANTGRKYLDHWYKLEHWSDPEGVRCPLDKLRSVSREAPVEAKFDPLEPLIATGEQVRKARIVDSRNVRVWGDFFDGRKIEFAAFLPPGRYETDAPRSNEFWRLAKFESAVLREVISPASSRPVQELELSFRCARTGESNRFLVSGFRLDELPTLPTSRYSEGLYMPMGIGVPPFYQSYTDLQQRPPQHSPFFSVLLDSRDGWLNHHDVGIDGPILHRDDLQPNTLHAYLLSYERETLVGHWTLTIGDEFPVTSPQLSKVSLP
jgi:hypothetical protein